MAPTKLFSVPRLAISVEHGCRKKSLVGDGILVKSEPSNDGVIEVKTKQKYPRGHSLTFVSQRRKRALFVDLVCKMG